MIFSLPQLHLLRKLRRYFHGRCSDLNGNINENGVIGVVVIDIHENIGNMFGDDVLSLTSLLSLLKSRSQKDCGIDFVWLLLYNVFEPNFLLSYLSLTAN